MNRRKYKIGKRRVSMLRIYRAAEKLLEKSKGARVYLWKKRLGEICGMDPRTVQRYLGTVVAVLERNYQVRYTKGKGWVLSCPAWEARKAAHGDLFDPPKLSRIARSHWLRREVREMREWGRQELPPYTLRGYTGENSSTNAPAGRSRRGPPDGSERQRKAPAAMHKLARSVLSKKRLPHCPRIENLEALAHSGAVNLLRQGYHRDDVGPAVRRALRITDTAEADGLPRSSPCRYFWGVLRDLSKALHKPSEARLRAERRQFWRAQLAEGERMQVQLVAGGHLEPGQETVAVLHCRAKLSQLAACGGAQ